MAIADGFILQTNSCGDIAHITKNPGYGPDANFVVARRVNFLAGEPLPQVIIDQQNRDAADKATKTLQEGMPETGSTGEGTTIVP
jgi:hypothetical protein